MRRAALLSLPGVILCGNDLIVLPFVSDRNSCAHLRSDDHCCLQPRFESANSVPPGVLEVEGLAYGSF